ncbi:MULTISPECIES: peroxiredoxin [unclassified Iodidimonas]|jgi:peroxiredoxin (alkyl hydroperoxide reductase subunit C)|uniref:peroxiredoxin n=1 Tax=unclassified Iodidimonas TaxID=2626145 RepID=UPI00049F0042|nr:MULTISPECIES: peroxiredoxin [unclassified Iodidimonas]GAK34373.1 alkyl hydroperoxide reductase subunit C [alpha proteobacterium Q-1]
MLTIGDKFPAFDLKAISNTDLPDGDFPRLTDQDFSGKWKLVFFWPKDFTFICPTEILAFDALADEFTDRDCVVLGASTDTDFVHFAWRKSREDLGAVKFPWLADNKKELSSALGILEKDEAVALRASFLVDPNGIIRMVQANDLSVGRNPEEVLRILDALQTDELCPCNWHSGEDTIDVAKEVA